MSSIDELERLRKELSVAPAVIITQGYGFTEMMLKCERLEKLLIDQMDEATKYERDSVVAWLRAEALEWEETGPARLALGLMSDAIERGEHRREEEG